LERGGERVAQFAHANVSCLLVHLRVAFGSERGGGGGGGGGFRGGEPRPEIGHLGTRGGGVRLRRRASFRRLSRDGAIL